jgi:hypothetical protein
MLYMITPGASSVGRGISSVICNAASYHISDSADCNRPRIQATPLDQPVSFAKSVKTKLASFLPDVARMVILITMTAVIDQYTTEMSVLGYRIGHEKATYRRHHSIDQVDGCQRYY